MPKNNQDAEQQNFNPAKDRKGVVQIFNPDLNCWVIKPDKFDNPDNVAEVRFRLSQLENKKLLPAPGDIVKYNANRPYPIGNTRRKAQDATKVIIERYQSHYFTSDMANYVINPGELANPGLVLDKFADHELGDKNERHVGKSWLKTYKDRYNSLIKKEEYKESFNSFIERWQQMLENLEAGQCEMQTNWRLAMHLGRNSVLENATVALHRIYGFPYLPGQSLKGLAHAYAVLVEYQNNQRKIDQLFGTQDQEGQVIFLDAVPSVLPKLELDVLTPHFPDWYDSKKAPSDNQNPVPVNFLTVAPNSPFIFAVAPSTRLRNDKSEPDKAKPTKDALNLLCKALQELGAGAKTAAGYGQFKSEKV